MKLQNLFRRPDYQSDATRFLNALKQQHPALETQQMQGRALLWNTPPQHAATLPDAAQATGRVQG